MKATGWVRGATASGIVFFVSACGSGGVGSRDAGEADDSGESDFRNDVAHLSSPCFQARGQR